MDDQCRTLNARINPGLAEVRAESELELWEAAALAEPLGHLPIQTRVNSSWASEGLAVLGWAIERFDLPAHDCCVDPKAVTNAVEFLQSAAATLAHRVTLRSCNEIQTGADRAFAVHWRLRQLSLTRAHMDFAEFARNAWFGPLNIEGVTLADSDLSIGGVPIARAGPAAVQTAASIAVERHRAFNWLLGNSETYSEVDTST